MTKQIKFFDPVSPESVNTITNDLYSKTQILENNFRSLAVGNQISIFETVDLCVVRGDADPVILTTNNTTFNFIINKVLLVVGSQVTTLSEVAPGYSVSDVETALISLETSKGEVILNQIRTTLKYSSTAKIFTPTSAFKVVEPNQGVLFKIHEATMEPITQQPTTVVLEGFYL